MHNDHAPQYRTPRQIALYHYYRGLKAGILLATIPPLLLLAIIHLITK